MENIEHKLKLKGDQIIEDGKLFFQSPLLESVVVVGKVKEREENGHCSWLNLMIYGTENCCQGSVGTVYLGNGTYPMRLNTLNSLDLNVFDIQPVVMKGSRTVSNLGIISAGYGCSGNGARLIDTNEVKVYDILPTNRKSDAFRLCEGFQIRPDIEGKKFWLQNPRKYIDSYKDAGATVDESIVTYNSVNIPEKLQSPFERSSFDITPELVKCGVDIEASLELAKSFIKTRRIYYLEHGMRKKETEEQ
jgi:hypothetical protein